MTTQLILTGHLGTMIDCGKDKRSYSCAKYYSPPEHLAVGETVVLFRGRVIFKQHVQKKHKWLGIKLYNMCDSKGQWPLYNMTVYLDKDRKHATPSVTAAEVTVPRPCKD